MSALLFHHLQELQEAQEKQQLLIKQKLVLENNVANSEKELKKVQESVVLWRCLFCSCQMKSQRAVWIIITPLFLFCTSLFDCLFVCFLRSSHLSFCLFAYLLWNCLSVCSVCLVSSRLVSSLSVCLSACLLPVCLFVCLSACLFACLPACLPACLSFSHWTRPTGAWGEGRSEGSVETCTDAVKGGSCSFADKTGELWWQKAMVPPIVLLFPWRILSLSLLCIIKG